MLPHACQFRLSSWCRSHTPQRSAFQTLCRNVMQAVGMRLRRSVVRGPGLRRVRRGADSRITTPTARRSPMPKRLQRINDLVIPPAWKKVWICPHPNGHIQAVGTDAAGRRQYIYHQKWQEERGEEKFDRVLEMSRRASRDAPTDRRGSRAVAGWSATGCWRWRCTCSISATSGPAASSTPRRTTRSASRPCCASTSTLRRGGGRVRLPGQERGASDPGHRGSRGSAGGAGAASPPRTAPIGCWCAATLRDGPTFTPMTSMPGSRK